MLYIFLFLFISSVISYEPTWESLDSRPLPEWYDTDKFGIFVHWGVFSVPAYRSEWLWWYWRGTNDTDVTNFMEKNYPGLSYGDLGPMFTATDFNATKFADLVEAAGAKYFVITTKHHEGFTLWPSITSFNWNSVDIGAHRDLVKEFEVAIKKAGIHFGVYFSQFDWFHPQYLRDRAEGTQDFPTSVSLVQMKELVNNYSPEVIWSDGDWEQPPEYWQAKEFLAWLFTDSKVKDTIVVNDRWGFGVSGHHGSFLTNGDAYLPGHLMKTKWESCFTLDVRSWGYRRDIKSEDVRTSLQVIELLVKVISWGGNFLLNIGPDHLGNIPAIFEDRLRDVGKFVKANEEAIFGSKPWIHQNDSDSIWYTSKIAQDYENDLVYNPQINGVTIVYAFVLHWDSEEIQLKSVKSTDNIKVTLLGTSITLKSQVKGGVLTVTLPSERKLPYPEAFVLKIENAGSSKHKPKVH